MTADGSGQVSHAGSALLVGVADRVGLTRALSDAMAPTRSRRSAHDPGVVLRDLVVTLADGGTCLSDRGTLRNQPDLFGGVPSDPTAFRVIDSIDADTLERLRGAVAIARARARKLGARAQRQGRGKRHPTRTVIDRARGDPEPAGELALRQPRLAHAISLSASHHAVGATRASDAHRQPVDTDRRDRREHCLVT